MANRAYGQYCGLARAAEMIGERWSLLVLRDLLVEPKRFTDLQRGLPGIPSNVLTTRLKDLEQSGVVARRVLPRPSGAVVYELTDYGRELEPVIVAMGRWGAKALGEPASDEVITTDSMVMALRSTFRPESAGTLRAGYELRLGDIVVHASVQDRAVQAAAGPLPDADLSMEAGPGIRALMGGELTPAQALQSGLVRVRGKRQLLNRFAEIFRI
ncbi:MAG: helix-turn-helix transcriptional regulator [Candidatus Eremiobacteraeota bacterium]|nr:helix-turn-helix transcriptional regulator [Candidatus Eremiobacteraeota bacterium]